MDDNEEFRAIEEQLLKILRSMNLSETVKWGAPVFMHAKRNIVSLAVFKHFVSLWFYDGVFLKDPAGKLISASEGKTKSLRQWRFTCLEDLDEQRIKSYVHEAMSNAEKGLIYRHIPATEIQPDPLFEDLLKQNKLLSEAFHRLSPACRREYHVYIAEAKKEETKRRRIEKITPQILQGTGLHDKYAKGKKE